MPCNQVDFLYNNLNAVSVDGNNPKFKEYLTSPRLIVCDEPEVIKSTHTLPMSLYKTEIALSGGTTRIRLYLWHVNDRNQKIDVGLRLSCEENDDVVITNINRITKTNKGTGNILEDGKCLAKGQLFGTLDSVSGSHTLSENEITVWQQTLEQSGTNPDFVGMVMEFDVVVTGSSASLKVRTFADLPTGSRGDFSLDPPNISANKHVRGYWEHSSAQFNLENLTQNLLQINGDQSTVEFKREYGILEGINESGEEHTHAYNKKTGSEHIFDINNIGCYGANLNYQVKIKNAGNSKVVDIYVSLKYRNINPRYFAGAAYISSPSLYAKRGVPKLPVSWSNATTTNNVVDLLSGQKITIQPQQTITLNVWLTLAGAAGAPVGLVIRNKPIKEDDTSGGGVG